MLDSWQLTVFCFPKVTEHINILLQKQDNFTQSGIPSSVMEKCRNKTISLIRCLFHIQLWRNKAISPTQVFHIQARSLHYPKSRADFLIVTQCVYGSNPLAEKSPNAKFPCIFYGKLGRKQGRSKGKFSRFELRNLGIIFLKNKHNYRCLHQVYEINLTNLLSHAPSVPYVTVEAAESR